MAKVLIASECFGASGRVAAVVEASGHEAIEFDSSLEIVEEVIEEEVDLVVLDEFIAPYSGLETCELLREDPEVPSDLPILLMLCRDVDVRVLEAKGVTDVFTKECGSIELEALILNHLGDKAGTRFVAPQ